MVQVHSSAPTKNNMTYKQWFLDKFKTYSGASCRYDLIVQNLIKRKDDAFHPKSEEPCWRCKGEGGCYIACGPYDSDWETCDVCKGTRTLTKIYYKNWYNEFKEKEKARKLKERIIAKELKRIKAKITRKELEFLLNHVER